MLEAEQTVYYLRKAKKGDKKAAEILLENNSLLIKSIIRRFKNKGVEYDDLYQLGCVGFLKAIKNETEIEGFHRAMKRDGVAMVKFLRWLKAAVSTGNETEISIDKKLYEFRAGQPHFNGISFDTIAGYKAHGSIVHY